MFPGVNRDVHTLQKENYLSKTALQLCHPLNYSGRDYLVRIKKMRTGRCQCGEIRYQSVGASLALYVCHCRECQKQSASAFGLTLEVPRAGFRVTQGKVKYWSRATDSGRRLKCAFCPNCGSRLWHKSEAISETLSIKAGSLDEPIDISKAIHVWVSRKLPGVIIPEGAKQFLED